MSQQTPHQREERTLFYQSTNEEIFSSATYQEKHHILEKEVKEIHSRDQNLQRNIEQQKQRLLRGLSSNQRIKQQSISKVSKGKNVVINIHSHKVQHHGEDRFIHQSETELHRRVRILQNQIEVYRQNQGRYIKQIEGLKVKIVQLQTLISEKQSLIIQITRQRQTLRQRITVIEKNFKNCSRCENFQKQFITIRESHRFQIQKINAQFIKSKQLYERKIKQFQLLIIDKEKVIASLTQGANQEFQLRQKQLRERLARLETQWRQALENYNSKEKETIDLNEKIRVISLKYKQQSQLSQSKDKQIKKLQIQFRQSRTVIDQKLFEIDQLKQTIFRLEHDKSSSVQRSQNQITQLQQENKRLILEIKRIQKQFSERMSIVIKQTENSHSISMKLEEVNQLLQNKQEEIFKFQNEISRLRIFEKKYSQAQNEFKSFKEESARQINQLTQEMIAQRRKISQYQQNFFEKQNDFKNLSYKFDQAVKTNNELRITIQQYQKNIRIINEKMNKTQMDSGTKDHENQWLKQQLENYKRKEQTQSNNARQLTEQLNNMRFSIEKYKSQIQRVSIYESRCHEWEQYKITIDSKLDQYSQNERNLKRKISELQFNLQGKDSSLLQLKNQISRNAQEIQRLRQQLKNQSINGERVSEYQRLLSQKANQIEILKQEIQRLESMTSNNQKIYQLQMTISEKNQKLEQYQWEIQRLKKDNDRLKSEIDEYRNNDPSNKVIQLQYMIQDRDRAIRQLQRQFVLIQQRTTISKTTIYQKEQTIIKLENQIRQFEEKIYFLTNQAQKGKQSQERITQLEIEISRLRGFEIRMKEFQKYKITLQMEIQHLRKLEFTVQQKNNRIYQLEAQIQDKVAQIRKLEHTILVIKSSRPDTLPFEQVIADKETIIKNYESQRERILFELEQLRGLRGEIQRLKRVEQQFIFTQSETTKEFQSKIIVLSQQLRDYQAKINDLEKYKIVLEMQIQQLRKSNIVIQQRTNRICQLERQIQQKIAEIRRLEQQIVILRNQRPDNSGYERTIAQKQNTIQIMRVEIQRLNLELQSQKTNPGQSSSKQYQEKVSNLEHQISRLKVFEIRMKEFQKYKITLQMEIQQLRKSQLTIQQKNRKILELQQQIQQRITQIRRLEQQIIIITNQKPDTSAFQETIAQRENTIKTLQIQKQRLIIELSELRGLKQQIQRLRGLQEHLIRAQQHIRFMQQQLAKKQQQQPTDNVKLQEAQKTITDLRVRIENLSVWQFKYTQITKTVQQLKTKLIKLEEIGNSAQLEKDKYLSEIQLLKKQINDYKEEVRMYDSVIIQKDQKIAQLESQITRLSQIIDQQNQEILRLQQIQHHLMDAQNHIKNLQQQLSNLPRPASPNNQQLEKAKNTIQDLKRQLQQITIKYQEATINIQNLRVQITNISSRVIDVTPYEKQIQQLLKQITILKHKLQQSDLLQKQLHDANKKVQICTIQINALKKIQAQFKNAQQRIKDLENSRYSLMEMESQLRKNKQEIERELELARKKLKQLEEKPQPEFDFVSKLQEAQAYIGQLLDQLHQAEAHIQILNQQIERFKVFQIKLRAAEAEVNRLRTQIQNPDFKKYEEVIEDKQRKIKQLQEAIQRLSKLAREIDPLKAQLDMVSNQLIKAEDFIRYLEEQLANKPPVDNEEIERLNKLILQLRGQNELLLNDKQIISDQLLKLKDYQAKWLQSIKTIQTLDIEMAHYRQLQILYKESQTKIIDLQNFKDSSSILQQDLKRIQLLLSEQTNKKLQLTTQLENAKKRLAELEDKKIEPTIDLSAKLQQAQAYIRELQIRLQQAQRNINYLNEQIDRLKELQGKLNAAQHQIEQLIIQIQSYESIDRKLELLQNENSRLQRENSMITTLKDKNAEYQQKIHSLQQDLEKYIFFKKKFDESEVVKNQDDKKQKLDYEKIKELQKKLFEAEENIERLNNQLKIANDRLFTSQNQKNKLSSENQRMELVIRQWEDKYHRIDVEVSKLRLVESRYLESQRKITQLNTKISQLRIFETKYIEMEKKYQSSIAESKNNLNQKDLIEARNALKLSQQEIQRLRTSCRRWQEQVLIYKKKITNIQSQLETNKSTDKDLWNIKRSIENIMSTYHIHSTNYAYDQQAIPTYLREFIGTFIHLHTKLSQLTPQLDQFVTENAQLIKLNRMLNEQNERLRLSQGSTLEIQNLEQKIIRLHGSNENYLRMNNSLSAKLEASQLERTYLFNQYLTLKGQLEKLQNSNTNSRVNASNTVDIPHLRSKVNNIEEAASHSIDRMKIYYDKIQKDVDGQLGGMRRAIDVLEENQRSSYGSNNRVNKHIVMKLQLEIKQLQSYFRLFQNNISDSMRNSSLEMGKAFKIISDKLNDYLHDGEQTQEMKYKLYEAQQYIESMQNEKDLINYNIQLLKKELQFMRKNIETLNNQITASKIENQRLVSINQQLKDQIQNKQDNQLVQQYNDLLRKYKQLEEDNFNLEEEKRKLLEDFQAIQLIRNKQSTQDNLLMIQIDQLKAKLFEKQTKLQELAKLQTQIKILKSKAQKESNKTDIESETIKQYQYAIQKLQLELEDREKHITFIESEKNNLANQIVHIQKEKINIASKLQQFEYQLNQVRAENDINNQSQKILHLSTQCDKLSASLEMLKNQKAQLLLRIELLERQNQQQKQKLSQASQELVKILAKLQDAQKAIFSMKEQRQGMLHNFSEMQNEIFILKNDTERYLEKIQTKDNENENLLIEKNNLEQKIQYLTSDLRQKEQQNHSIPDIRADRDSILQSNTILSRKIEAQEQELKNQLNQKQILTNKINQAQEYIFKIQQQRNMMIQDLNAIKQSLQEQTDKNKTLIKLSQEITSENRTLQDQNKEIKHKQSELKLNIQHLKKQIVRLEGIIAQLEEQLKKSKNQLDSIKQEARNFEEANNMLLTRIEENVKANNEMDQNITKLNLSLEDYFVKAQQLQPLQQQKETLTKQNQELKNKIKQYGEVIKNLQQTSLREQAEARNIQHLQSTILQLTNERQVMSSTISSLRAQIHNKQQVVHTMEASSSSVIEEKQKIEQEIQNLRKQNKELRELQKKANKKVQQLIHLEVQYKDLENAIENFLIDQKNFEDKLNQKKKIIHEYQIKLKANQSQVQELKKQNAALQQKYQQSMIIISQIGQASKHSAQGQQQQLRAKLIEAHQQLAQDRQYKQQLELRILDIEQQVIENQQRQRQFQEFSEQMTEKTKILEKEKEAIFIQNEKLKDDVKQIEIYIGKLVESKKEDQIKIQELEKYISALEEDKQSILKEYSDLETLYKQSIKHKDGTGQISESKLGQTYEIIDNLSEELNNLKTQYNQLHEEKEKLQAQNKKFSRTNSSLTRKIEMISGQIQDNQLLAQITKLERQKDQLTDMVNNLKDQNMKYVQILKELQINKSTEQRQQVKQSLQHQDLQNQQMLSFRRSLAVQVGNRISTSIQKFSQYIQNADTKQQNKQVIQELDVQGFPALKNLYQTTDLKIRVLNAQIIEKDLKILNLTKQLENAQNQTKKMRQSHIQLKSAVAEFQGRLTEAAMTEQRYQQISKQLDLKENLVKEHQQQINSLKSQLTEYLSKYGQKRQTEHFDQPLKQQNFKLRSKLNEYEDNLNDLENNITQINVQKQELIQFLHNCLIRIDDLEYNAENLEKQLKQARAMLTNFLSRQPRSSENAQISKEKLKLLEEKLHHNMIDLQQIQEQAEEQNVIKQIKSIVDSQENYIPQKSKMQQYLDFLEEKIKNRKSSPDRSPIEKSYAKKGHSRNISGKSQFDQESLQRQLKELSGLVQLYHDEANRRRQFCIPILKQTLQLLNNLQWAFQNHVQDTGDVRLRTSDIPERIQEIGNYINLLERELSQEGVNQRQYIRYNVDRQMGNESQKQQYIQFLDMIAHDRRDPNEDEFEKAIIKLKNTIDPSYYSKENQSTNTIALFKQHSNYPKIFEEIKQRQRIIYQMPTKISQNITNSLVSLLQAKDDEQFLQIIQLLFENIHNLELKYEGIIQRKDRQIKEHTQKMNQIFNRSEGSESSEDFQSLTQQPVIRGMSSQAMHQSIKKQEKQTITMRKKGQQQSAKKIWK